MEQADTPSCGGDTRYPVLRGNLALINLHRGEFARVFIVLQRVGGNRRNVNLTTEVAGKVTEVGTLLDDGAEAAGLVPPVGLCDSLIGACVASNGGHDGEVVFGDDLLHHLCRLEISQHIPGGGSIIELKHKRMTRTR